MLFVCALGAAVILFGLWHQANGAERKRAEVASTATAFLQALTNFQSATIDHDVAAIKAYAVGDFADQVKQFFGPSAVDAIKKADAKSTGQVASVFVESLSGVNATAFGVVNEVVTNKNNPTPRNQVVRIEIGMLDTAQGWKINRVDILQSPTATPTG